MALIPASMVCYRAGTRQFQMMNRHEFTDFP
jgi:hypothetical protein